ncbi:hypothetical protein J0H33_05735 [bacterium]|nr:hypothetical protein [bacterium]
MRQRVREKSDDRVRRRRIAIGAGAGGFVLLLVAVQMLTSSSIGVLVAGWILVVWGAGAALWAFRELWETRARQP